MTEEMPGADFDHDVFISHATEDKADFVRGRAQSEARRTRAPQGVTILNMVLTLMLLVTLVGACASTAIGSMVVVGKEVKAVAATLPLACVRYRAFDKTEETCVFFEGTENACWKEAVIGKPLPEACR